MAVSYTHLDVYKRQVTRSAPQGIELVYGDYDTFEFTPEIFGALVQYPAANGAIRDYLSLIHISGRKY